MKTFVRRTLLLGLLGTMAACSGGGSGGSGGGGSSGRVLNISGTVSNTGSLPSSLIPEFIQPLAAGIEARCLTLGGTLRAAKTDLDGSGFFAVDLEVDSGAGIGCLIVRQGALQGATIIFNSGTSLSGNSSGQSGYAPKSDSTVLALGSISIAAGTNGAMEATLASPPQENGTAAAASFAAMTGAWTVTGVQEGQGFSHPCDMDFKPSEYPTENASCKANWSSRQVFIHTFKATASGEEDRMGFSLWNSQADFNTCGNREGISLDPAWSIDTNSTPYASGVGTAFTKPASFPFNNLDNTVLTKAPFRKWVSTANPTNHNCPQDYDNDGAPDGIDETSSTVDQQCAAATSCADFAYTADADGSAAKFMCVTNSMASGGQLAYQWGTSFCGHRFDHNQLNFGNIVFNSSGSGCQTANCSNEIDATVFENGPLNRTLNGEMFVAGSMANGQSTELDAQTVSSENCHMYRHHSFTITQTSATTATIFVQVRVEPKVGSFNSSVCLQEDWIERELSQPQQIKVTIQKN